MKKAILFAVFAAMLLGSCADSKTFRKADGTEFVAKPYGWMTKEEKIDGVEYDLCTGNIIWSVVFCETVAAASQAIEQMDFDEKSFGENLDHFFFENTAVRVTKDKVEKVPYSTDELLVCYPVFKTLCLQTIICI